MQMAARSVQRRTNALIMDHLLVQLTSYPLYVPLLSRPALLLSSLLPLSPSFSLFHEYLLVPRTQLYVVCSPNLISLCPFILPLFALFPLFPLSPLFPFPLLPPLPLLALSSACGGFSNCTSCTEGYDGNSCLWCIEENSLPLPTSPIPLPSLSHPSPIPLPSLSHPSPIPPLLSSSPPLPLPILTNHYHSRWGTCAHCPLYLVLHSP